MGGFDFLGEVIIQGKKYLIDAYIADQKTIRFYSVAPPQVAISMLDLKVGHTVQLKLGDVFDAVGQVIQVGWDETPRGGRLVLCMAR
jgi:hypothetical protein